MADGGNQGSVVDVRQIADALGITKRSAERRANREEWPYVERSVRGGRVRVYEVVRLPKDVQVALLLKLAPPASTARTDPTRRWDEERIASAWQAYERRNDDQKAMAKRRMRALLAVEALIANERMSLLAARKLVADQLQREDSERAKKKGAKANSAKGDSARSLRRWAAAVDGAPRDVWLYLLLPEYLGRPGVAPIPDEAWDFYKGDYLRLEAPTAAGCYERLQRVAAERGWVLPSSDTFERRINREIPLPVQVLARQGTEALLRMYPAQERDRSVFHAMQAVNADGHKFDVFVRFGNGIIARPILVGVQDLRSGKLLGWRLAETESADLIRLAFMDTVRNYGIPGHAWLDNGRGFASKMLTGGVANRFRFKVREEDPTGILVGMGIKIHWTTPYHGQSKPIERAWLDFCDRVAKHPSFAGAYTGNSPDAKPENYGKRAIPIETFQRVLAEEIVAHNARTGRRATICAGRSFDQVFAESYATAPIRKATGEQLRQLLLAAEKVKCSVVDGSVRLVETRYWSEALAGCAGKHVIVRFDPDNLTNDVSVYALDGTYIGEASVRGAVAFADTRAAKEHARGKKQFQRAIRDRLAAERRMDAAQVAAQIPAPPPENLPVLSVVSPIFGQGNTKAPSPTAVPVKRTGTDDARAHNEGALSDHLARLQARQLEQRGWQPPVED